MSYMSGLVQSRHKAAFLLSGVCMKKWIPVFYRAFGKVTIAQIVLDM